MKIILSKDFKNKISTFGISIVIVTTWFLIGTFAPYKWLPADAMFLADGLYKDIGLAMFNGMPYVFGGLFLAALGYALFRYLSKNIKFEK